jgi:adenylate cyclase, class 2
VNRTKKSPLKLLNFDIEKNTIVINTSHSKELKKALKIEANHSTKHKMVELKARVNDLDILRKRLADKGADYKCTFHQRDQYFVVPEGRLKLRTVKDSESAELIYYERENILGPKSDDAYILRVHEPEDLKHILTKILKPLIVVEKEREIYQYKGTQIHLDRVKKLGDFIEFEREVADNQESIEKGLQVLENLTASLEIHSSNLESLSYSDLLEK